MRASMKWTCKSILKITVFIFHSIAIKAKRVNWQFTIGKPLSTVTMNHDQRVCLALGLLSYLSDNLALLSVATKIGFLELLFLAFCSHFFKPGLGKIFLRCSLGTNLQ